jgi:hypothetical protein
MIIERIAQLGIDVWGGLLRASLLIRSEHNQGVTTWRKDFLSGAHSIKARRPFGPSNDLCAVAPSPFLEHVGAHLDGR